MADTSEIISNIVDKNSATLQDTFGQMMLDKIRDVVDDRKMEIAQSFLGAVTEEEPDTDPGEDDLEDDDLDADDIEAEADEIGDEEDPAQDGGDSDEEG